MDEKVNEPIESENKPIVSVKKYIWLAVGLILLLAVCYTAFSYFKSDSQYAFQNIIEPRNNADSNIPHLVKGTIQNARIMVSFQDNVDEATAKDILANYAKNNKNMTWNVFQGRVCSIWVNPLTTNLDSEITNLYPNANFESIEKGINYSGKYDGKPAIQTMAVNQDCNVLKAKIESLGYEVTFFDITPVLATVNTDTNKKQKLLELLQKDKNIKDAKFDYPV